MSTNLVFEVSASCGLSYGCLRLVDHPMDVGLLLIVLLASCQLSYGCWRLVDRPMDVGVALAVAVLSVVEEVL